MNELVNLLQRVEIFQDIPEHLLENLCANLHIDHFPAGSPVIRKGAEGNSMFIITEGKVNIHDEDHIVATMQAGNFFGEFSLLDEAPRSMSVTTTTDSKLIKISRELFYSLIQSQPELAKKIVSTLTNRLRKQNEAIINQLKSREEELTRLVNERTHALMLSNEEIKLKNKEITDNIRYAKHIQAAILPDLDYIQQAIADSFVLYLPKDIVSGDFYHFYKSADSAILIAADCTGHGVTGAFLSVVGSSLLSQIIGERQIKDPGKILDQLNEAMIEALNQHHSDSSDGMDIAICNFNWTDRQLSYAGANRSLWLVRNRELLIFKHDRSPIGGLQITREQNFNTHTIQLEKNDTVYIFSDGYADQFGGPNGKKMMTKLFKETLLSIQDLKMEEQKNYLQHYFENWKGRHEQVDDVLVIGVRV